jgi:hypothetical protein
MGLAMDSEDPAKTYLVETRTAIRSCGCQTAGEKRGPQNEGKSHDVVENKCRKNVGSEFCHDVNENRPLVAFCYDVDEKEGFSRQQSGLTNQLSTPGLARCGESQLIR